MSVLGQDRVVCFKQSGEQLSSDGRGIDADAAQRTAARLIDVYRRSEELAVAGLIISSGGGNHARGNELIEQGLARPNIAHSIGRLSIVSNVLLLAGMLEDSGIATRRLLPPSMTIGDTALDKAFEPYSAKLIHEAHQEGEVVFLAGWPGIDGVTSDAAVVRCAGEYYQYCDSEAVELPNLVVLKGTQFDGVFEADPKQVPDARRYKVISAQTMLANHEQLGALDQDSLMKMTEHNIHLLVYQNDRPLAEILENQDVGGVGTLVVPCHVEPVFY